jgi:hypothetical protein
MSNTLSKLQQSYVPATGMCFARGLDTLLPPAAYLTFIACPPSRNGPTIPSVRPSFAQSLRQMGQRWDCDRRLGKPTRLMANGEPNDKALGELGSGPLGTLNFRCGGARSREKETDLRQLFVQPKTGQEEQFVRSIIAAKSGLMDGYAVARPLET